MIYVIGSLRNPQVPLVADWLRSKLDEYVFDGWFAAGPEADDYWQQYTTMRGQTYAEALADAPAQNTFNFDLRHLQLADRVVLVLPAGKSGHLELGWALGKGKKGYILLPEKEAIDRYDVMYNFATAVVDDLEVLYGHLTQSGGNA
jgi:hypothetical protein